MSGNNGVIRKCNENCCNFICVWCGIENTRRDREKSTAFMPNNPVETDRREESNTMFESVEPNHGENFWLHRPVVSNVDWMALGAAQPPPTEPIPTVEPGQTPHPSHRFIWTDLSKNVSTAAVVRAASERPADSKWIPEPGRQLQFETDEKDQDGNVLFNERGRRVNRHGTVLNAVITTKGKKRWFVGRPG